MTNENIWSLVLISAFIIPFAVLGMLAGGKNTSVIKSTNTLTKVVEKSTDTLTSTYEVTGTYYNAVPGQTDSTPLITADNAVIDLEELRAGSLKWVALSRDLLKRWGGPFEYGDTLTVSHANDQIRGSWIVHDTMNRRYSRRVDFLTDVNAKFPHMTPNILISK